jgi:hypothetical protein
MNDGRRFRIYKIWYAPEALQQQLKQLGGRQTFAPPEASSAVLHGNDSRAPPFGRCGQVWRARFTLVSG